ncbi:MAG: ferrous iron transport protein A [Alphaproteobacteria bacterium]
MDAIANIHPLGSLRPGQTGRVVGLDVAVLPDDMEIRLIRMGVDEGAAITLLHEGPVRRDPLAVKVDGVLVALRRSEAASIMVALDS